MPKPLPAVKPVPGSRLPATAPPPLWVWVAIGIGVLVGFGLLVGMTVLSERQISRQFTADAESLLRQEWTERTDSVLRVVVLGTSQVEYSVANTDFFSRHCHKPVRVVKLFRESVNLDGFTQSSPIFQLLERYPPDVLCVEENLLLFRLTKMIMKPSLNERLATTIHYHLQWQLHKLLTQIGWVDAAPVPPSFQGFPPEYYQVSRKDTLNLSYPLAEIRSRPVRIDPELTTLYPSLRGLRQQGTRLVLLHIPRPAALETVIHGEDREPRLRQLIDQYKQRYQMEYWQFDQPMPFRYFVDYAHLNQVGNPVYSAWLANKICSIRPHTPQ